MEFRFMIPVTHCSPSSLLTPCVLLSGGAPRVAWWATGLTLAVLGARRSGTRGLPRHDARREPGQPRSARDLLRALPGSRLGAGRHRAGPAPRRAASPDRRRRGGRDPYFSRIETVDTLGLNDAWIARHGSTAPADFLRPGHRRGDRGSASRAPGHFLLGHPTLMSPAEFRSPSAPALLGAWVEDTLGFREGDSGSAHPHAHPDRRAARPRRLVSEPHRRAGRARATWPSVELSR